MFRLQVFLLLSDLLSLEKGGIMLGLKIFFLVRDLLTLSNQSGNLGVPNVVLKPNQGVRPVTAVDRRFGLNCPASGGRSAAL